VLKERGSKTEASRRGEGRNGGGLEDKSSRLSSEKGEPFLAISLYRWCEDPVSHGRIPLTKRHTETTGLYL